MKILVICQYYSPEPFKVADVCEALVEKGHEVDVVTSFPNYPMGKVYDGYKNSFHKEENINGVNVHRVFTIGRKSGFLYRVVNYYAFSIASSLFVNKLNKDYDVVFVYQLSPVLMAQAGVKYKKKHNKKLLLYCLDLWPDSLTLGGLKKGGPIYNYFKKKSVELVNIGCTIILDWGFWSLENRRSLTEFCRSQNVHCEWHYIDVDDRTWNKNIEERNLRVLNGEDGSDYYLDEGLMRKLLSIWEAPSKDAIDVWYTLERK